MFEVINGSGKGYTLDRDALFTHATMREAAKHKISFLEACGKLAAEFGKDYAGFVDALTAGNHIKTPEADGPGATEPTLQLPPNLFDSILSNLPD